MHRTLMLSSLVPLLLATGPAQTPGTPPLRVAVQCHNGTVEVYEWKGDLWLEKTIEQVSEVGGGTFTFSSGVFPFERGVRVKNVKDIHFRGSPGTVFRFREMPEFGRIAVSAAGPLSGRVFEVDRPELMRPGAYYQVFRPDLEGNRILELETGKIEGSKVEIAWHTNAQLSSFEPGMLVFPALNFFDGWLCSNVSFRDIVFDGNCDVNAAMVAGKLFWGHTMHCGVLLRNRYASRPDDAAPRPATENLSVQDCTFRRLLGRAVTAYNMKGVTVANCRFEQIGAEGVEIDHLSYEAVVTGCIMRDVKLAIRLNDCNDVVVGSSLFTDCVTGLHVTALMKEPGLNQRLVVNGNVFHRCSRAIGLGENAGAMVITANVISEARSVGIELQGRSIVCVGNSIVGCSGVGIRAIGTGCRIEGNVIEPASPTPKTFVAVEQRDS